MVRVVGLERRRHRHRFLDAAVRRASVKDMDSKEIEAYLTGLSELLARCNVVGKIVFFGGAAMVLAHKARVSTKDVDAVFIPKDVVCWAAAEVTRDCGAPRVG